jgi:hypothetical protein
MVVKLSFDYIWQRWKKKISSVLNRVTKNNVLNRILPDKTGYLFRASLLKFKLKNILFGNLIK